MFFRRTSASFVVALTTVHVVDAFFKYVRLSKLVVTVADFEPFARVPCSLPIVQERVDSDPS